MVPYPDFADHLLSHHVGRAKEDCRGGTLGCHGSSLEDSTADYTLQTNEQTIRMWDDKTYLYARKTEAIVCIAGYVGRRRGGGRMEGDLRGEKSGGG